MKHDVNIKKASNLAIIINSLQILLVMGIALYIFLTDVELHHIAFVQWIVLGAALLVSWGAFLDIREAIEARHIQRKVYSIEKSLNNVENLNNTLRAQRHDFLNHLQVVYSLMEMHEYKEAGEYIERVYGDISAVSRIMRTTNPSVNALLKVKLATAEKQNVKVELNITSAWEDLTMPGWEMCRVLGNLIDNALDALQETENPQLTITLAEDLKTFHFSIANNGPIIPMQSRSRIFLPGIAGKTTGQGMGLFIVRNTLQNRGGDIALQSNHAATSFAGWVPKEITSIEAEAPESAK